MRIGHRVLSKPVGVVASMRLAKGKESRFGDWRRRVVASPCGGAQRIDDEGIARAVRCRVVELSSRTEPRSAADEQAAG